MFRTAAMFISVIGFAMPAIAQDKEPGLPENTIDCKQFKRTGPQEWIEAGTAVFDLGKIKDINLTNQPVTPRYFKFGGFDLYTVVEQKCGAAADSNPGGATAQAPASSEQAAVPKPELKQDKSEPVSLQMPTQANMEAVPVLEVVKRQSESTSCGDKKSIYVADGFAGAEVDGGLIEIVFNKEITASHTDFIIREFRKNKFEWIYKGMKVQENFMFTPAHARQEKKFSPLIFTPVHFSREKPVVLTLNYVRPNRNGTGEAILFLSGLRALFASKENVHRYRFEGNLPSQPLPEAFYFDRCE